MDNDILINQARQLYASLKIKQQLEQSLRLDSLLNKAYDRYQRRLNRCVLCYRSRATECDRFMLGKFCPHKNDDKTDSCASKQTSLINEN